MPSLNSLLAYVAIQAALNAGQLIRKGFGTDFEITSKANALDLVTALDKNAEKEIIGYIKEQFPDHAFLGEESGATGLSNAKVRWVIDPLDGTLNFAHHVPIFAVSIGAVVNGKTEVGVIYQPMTDELFTAQAGHGAYLNGKKLFVSKVSDMQCALGATGFPYSIDELRKVSLAQFSNFLDVGNPIRITGSAAINLAYVAAGRFDLCWGINLKPWDIVAGKLLVEEANGTVSNYDGTAYNILSGAPLIASNGILHNTAINLLQ